MNKFKNYTYVLGLALVALTTSCEDQSEEVTSLAHDHLFAPFGLEAKISNTVNARLSWKLNDEASSYSIELFANDSLTCQGTPVRTYEGLTADDMPFDIKGLEGDTKYTARLMAKGENLKDSKWNGVYFKTDVEQLMVKITDDDLTATSVTISWETGRAATDIIITPGDIKHTLTADEIAACKATVGGLEGNTSYSAKLVNGEKNCGSRTFITLIDPNTAIVVSPEGKDLQTAIEEATAEKNLILVQAGTYDITGGLTVSKDVQIIGERSTDRPILKGGHLAIAAGGLYMRNIIVDGNKAKSNHVFDFTTDGIAYASLEVESCDIKNFVKGLFYLNVTSSVKTISFKNCIISNIECSGSDFMDSRKGAYSSLVVSNNTMYNCSANKRELVRFDDASASFPDVKPTISVTNNTIVGTEGSGFKRVMYVRFPGNKITFKNNLVMNFTSYFSDQSKTDAEPTFANNNYYNAKTAGIIKVKVGDVETEVAKDPNCVDDKFLDPKFKDAANGNFTITNEDMKINKVGDPRWLE